MCLRASLASFHFFVVVLLILLFLHPLTIFLFLANPGSIFLAFFFWHAIHLFQFAAPFFLSATKTARVSADRLCVMAAGVSVERLSGLICSRFVSGCLLRQRIVLSKPTVPIFVDPRNDISLAIIAHFYTDISGGIRRARKYKGVRCVCAIRRK